MAAAESVARYILHLAANASEPTPVTQMQLHKLLYYAQGWMLAVRDAPLFESAIQAWQHGPVVVEVYPKFRQYEERSIPPEESRCDAPLSGLERGMIESVWRNYGRFAAWQLRDMTHREAPWMEARGGLGADERGRTPISNDSLRSFFRAQHDAACRKAGIDPGVLRRDMADLQAGGGVAFEDLVAEVRAERRSKSTRA